MAKLSIIILTWNSEKYIEACFESLLKSVQHLDYEILVVDNGSSDSSLSLLSKYLSNQITLIKNPTNEGVARARNKALLKVAGDRILILDIDTEINKEAIDGLIGLLEKDEHIGLCGCKLVSLTGEVQLSCRKFPSIRYKLYNLLVSRNIMLNNNESQFYKQDMNGNKPFEVDYVIGACQLFRRNILDEVGYLDEHIFYGPEDADFCLRIKKAGWKVVYLPTVSLIHHYQQISNKKIISKMSFLHAKGLAYYFLKHHSW
ncbi:MAG: glycosyltransferase family 2 protein [Paludibacteraceae bacterium]|nr:glycosyltransferase family 2 protein [Paludibacteraceae bacterium]